MERIKKHKRKICFIAILLLCFFYLGSKITYTSYESNIDGNVKSDVAKFKLLINGQDATSFENVLINDIKWDSTNTREGKLSPGSCGYFELELNPIESDVALLYKFSFIDHKIDSSKIIEFNSIKSSNSTIIKTAINEYSGIITLNDINNGVKPIIRIDFCNPEEGEQEPIVEDNLNLDDFFTIDFSTYQYLGEELVEYKE